MPKATQRAVPVEDLPAEEPRPAYPLRAVCAVKRGSDGDRAARMHIQKGLFDAFAELYGGRSFDGTMTQLLVVSCPEGDAMTARDAVLSRCDIYSVGSAREAEHLAEVIVAKAEAADMAGMGMNALTSVLDRIGARYDVITLEE